MAEKQSYVGAYLTRTHWNRHKYNSDLHHCMISVSMSWGKKIHFIYNLYILPHILITPQHCNLGNTYSHAQEILLLDYFKHALPKEAISFEIYKICSQIVYKQFNYVGQFQAQHLFFRTIPLLEWWSIYRLGWRCWRDALTLQVNRGLHLLYNSMEIIDWDIFCLVKLLRKA